MSRVPEPQPSSEPHDATRAEWVRRDIAGRGITDERVLDAMGSVARELFVPPELVHVAYDDKPHPIPAGQTISQPFIVAFMAEAAEISPGDRVLEVGTGSGYGAAVLSRLAQEVWTIERHPELAEMASSLLARHGFDNVHVRVGDGTLGLPEAAPYDAIVVTAGAPSVPPTLAEQLVDGGRLVIPTGPDERHQALLRVRRSRSGFETEDLGPVRFVPLVGVEGWGARSGSSDTQP